jgi:hypothetical protein
VHATLLAAHAAYRQAADLAPEHAVRRAPQPSLRVRHLFALGATLLGLIAGAAFGAWFG